MEDTQYDLSRERGKKLKSQSDSGSEDQNEEKKYKFGEIQSEKDNKRQIECPRSRSKELQRFRRGKKQRQQNGKPYIKTVLRHLESTKISDYLATQLQKLNLKYPPRNIPNEPYDGSQELVSLDCEMVITKNGSELIRVTIIDQKCNLIYDSWFQPKGQVIDYVTHITGITKQNLGSKKLIPLDEVEIDKINIILSKKVIVGHDLTNDLAVLPIKNKLFIDTVILYPHNLGLPFKQSLKNITLQYLNRPIQWASHDPIQDAKASLDLALFHIKQGRGIVAEVESTIPGEHYSIAQLLKQAQLSLERIEGLFLRGSRALGIQIDEDSQEYISDWDYYCVYKTSTIIDGRLIKLHNTDVTIYDTKTFNNLLHQENDLPAVELFFLPKECQYINNLTYPLILTNLLRQSLGFHLSKCRRKIKRFNQTIQNKNILQWKTLKVLHLQLRFLDYFTQLKQTNRIDQIMRTNKIWFDAKDRMKLGSFKSAYTFLTDIVQLQYQAVKKMQNLTKPLKDKSLNQVKAEKLNNQKMDKMQEQINPLKLSLVSLLLQQGLQSIQQYKISYHRHKIYSNLIQFHYLQSADFNHKICRESRGIILDESNNYNIISLPYFKFFEYNDPKHSQIKLFDWSQFKIYKKYDGSIATMYNYRQQWWVSSSRIPDGGNNYCFERPQTTTQFRIEFWKIFHGLGYKIPLEEDKDVTFIFQILSKDHIIVTKRQQSDLVLHGAFNRNNGRQLNHQEFGRKYSWRYSEEVVMQPRTLEDIVKVAESLNPLQQQGFIVCDKNYLRMKIKSTSYIKANWLSKLNLGQLKNPQKYILTQIILKGDSDSFLVYCPQWKPMIDDITAKIRFINEQCKRIYNHIQNLSIKEKSQIIEMQTEYLRPFIYSLTSDYIRWENRLQFLMNPKRFYKYLVQVKIQ